MYNVRFIVGTGCYITSGAENCGDTIFSQTDLRPDL